MKSYWKIGLAKSWRYKFENINEAIEVDGYTDLNAITDKFARHFPTQYSPTNCQQDAWESEETTSVLAVSM
jgi:hypothetical protein